VPSAAQPQVLTSQDQEGPEPSAAPPQALTSQGQEGLVPSAAPPQVLTSQDQVGLDPLALQEGLVAAVGAPGYPAEEVATAYQ